MDDETAKTIADLKAQMQSLMDEVKKLKSQQNVDPPTARLRPPTDDQAKTKTESVPIHPHPVGYTPFLPPEAREQTSMEQEVEGTTESAPKAQQLERMDLPMLDVSENGLIFRSQDNHHLVRLGGLFQFDDREFVDAGTTDMSKFLIRRARPSLPAIFMMTGNTALLLNSRSPHPMLPPIKPPSPMLILTMTPSSRSRSR
jgi:hypothetical protein